VPLAVLTYLCATPGRSASRDHLASIFWANSDQSRARQALRQNLTRLRNLLGHDAFEDRGTELRVACPLVSDFAEFQAALQRGDLGLALATYGGAFFPDYGAPGSVEFEHWLDAERERLHRLFVQAGEREVRRGLDSARSRDVLALSTRLRHEAPDLEGIRRLHLEVLIELRDALNARAEAEAIQRWLQEERREPEPATRRLIQRACEEKGQADVETSPILTADLVGRTREFSRIVACWNETPRGPSRHLHLEGRAGLGKTRLLEEVADRVRTIGGTALSIGAQPGDQHLANSFAADLALAMVSLPGSRAVSDRTASLLVGLHPSLGAAYPRAVVPDSGDGLTEQRGLAMAELLLSIAEESPLALLIDDVHWIDPESKRIVAAAIQRARTASVLTVTTGRPGGDGSLTPGADRILLKPLTLGDTEDFLSSLASFTDPSLGRRLAADLHRSSGGSPLLMLESVQLAMENGTLANKEGIWEVPDPERLLEWLGQRDALESRIKSLSTNARQVLLTLAATGVPVARKDLERALESGALSGDTLAELERRGYLAPKGERLDLAHDEIGATMLRMVPEDARKAAHARLGRALLDRGSDESQVVRRAARHLIEAGAGHELQRVFRSWVRNARARNDWAPASRLASELLGDHVTPTLVGELVRSLPAGIRWPLRRLAIAVLVIAGGAIALGVSF
jgi:DNA-binding SARP family transcriptional activator